MQSVCTRLRFATQKQAAFDVICSDNNGIQRTDTTNRAAHVHSVRLRNPLCILFLCLTISHMHFNVKRAQRTNKYLCGFTDKHTCWRARAHAHTPSEEPLGRDLFVALRSRGPPTEGWHGDILHAVTSYPVCGFVSQQVSAEDTLQVRELL